MKNISMILNIIMIIFMSINISLDTAIASNIETPCEVEYMIHINDCMVDFDNEIYYMNDEIYIPVRFFFEYIGGRVTWYEETSDIHIDFNSKSLCFKNGNNKITFDERDYSFDSFSFEVDNKTYIAIEKMCNLFGFDFFRSEQIKKIYVGIRTETELLEENFEYIRMDFPSPIQPKSYSIYINTDGGCILSFYDSEGMHEIKIYPEFETLKNVIKSVNGKKENYRTENYESDFIITEKKTIVLKIIKNGNVEEYYPDDDIFEIENLFRFWLEPIGKKNDFKIDDMGEAEQTIDYGYWENDTWTNLETNYSISGEVAVRVAKDVFEQINGTNINSMGTVTYESDCKKYYIIKVYENTKPRIHELWKSLWVTICKSNGRVVKVESFKVD